MDEHVDRGAEFEGLVRGLFDALQPLREHEFDAREFAEAEERKESECDEDIELARSVVNRFLTEDVALRLLPEQARKLLGPIDRWRWCFLHIRCCIVFGFLACRGPRTFRSFAYYLYRYWICVREAVGAPVRSPLAEDEREDYRTLVRALGSAFKPYLTEQLASIDAGQRLSEQVLAGTVDCAFHEDAAAIFERLLTTETAPALLGRATFEKHRKEPWFWFCRCWCLCAIRFGCALARGRRLRDWWRALAAFRRCLHDCFRPLVCAITAPATDACAEATFVAGCGNITAIEIQGSATGASFDRYTLTYSYGGGPPQADAVVYPDCSRPPAHVSATGAVMSGTLGYIDLGRVPPGITQLTVYVDVHDNAAGHVTCSTTFGVRSASVEIKAVAKVNAVVGIDPWHLLSSTKMIKDGLVPDPSSAVAERSIGGTFSIDGSAYTVGCNRIMTQFAISSFPAPPAAVVPAPASIAGGSVVVAPVAYDDTLGHPWNSGCFPFVSSNTILNGDLVAVWSTESCTFPVAYTVPKVVGTEWDSSALNGRFVLLLEVRDHQLTPLQPFPGSIAAVDQVVVWIDNQPAQADITSIGSVIGCGDLHLNDYVGTTAAIKGVAWDPPIDATALQQAPNDNFGSYSLTFQKNGGASGAIAAATPNTRVPNMWPALPGGSVGTLADWNIVLALDAGAGHPAPAGTAVQLQRGTRCAYVLTLTVGDTTHVGDSGANHSATKNYAINIINDIPNP